MKRWKKILLGLVVCVGFSGAALFVFREAVLLRVIEFATNPGHAFDPGLAPPAPDYNDATSWAALPDKEDPSDWAPPGLEEEANPLKDEVDVFYVHPTGFLGRDNWNGTPGQESNRGIPVGAMLTGQASAFNACGRVYAPYYRQATLYSFLEPHNDPTAENGYRALELAYSDVVRAFDHFIEHFNKGRPFIVASHSQGTAHALRLLAERIDQTELHSRMIAAYAIGYSMPDDMFDRVYKNLKRCTSPTDSGCVIHWDTFAEGATRLLPGFHWYPEGWESAKGKKTYCINPLTWSSGEERAPKDAHLGALAANFDASSGETSSGALLPQYTWAQCHEGVLWVEDQSGTPFSEGPTFKGSYHIHDYALFWLDIRHNAIERSKVFLAKRTKAQEMAIMKKGAEHVPLTNAKARLYKPGQDERIAGPIRLKPGSHLFIDDYLIESSTHVQREVNVPVRDDAIPNPIVTGKEDGCFQPYMTILRDPETKLFRMWYGRRTEDSNPGRSRIGYIESEDGVHWRRPAQILPEPAPIQFGISVIDEGAQFPDPGQRYKFGWYMDGGLKVAASSDGLAWTPMTSAAVLAHNHDINSIFYDPVRARYVATISVYRQGDTWTGNRRITMHSYSDTLLDWSLPHYVVLPNAGVDDGETQFYAMEAYLARGDLVIGMVKVLRDDLKVDDPPDPPEAYGVGYTALAWTRDGETWTRDPGHFFDPHPQKGTWDHAHAWIDEQVPVGDDVYLYYGGYARGHKVNRFEERQIGLVKMRRDRYVARAVGPELGVIRTPPVVLEGGEMTLNVQARPGSVAVRVLGETGLSVPGFAFEDCKPIFADSLAAPVVWKRPLSDVAGKPVRLEFALENARLFAFDLK